jgi:hypothetical protein
VIVQVVAEPEGAEGVESRVELFAAIRHDARVEGLSIRELADKHHVHRLGESQTYRHSELGGRLGSLVRRLCGSSSASDMSPQYSYNQSK